MDRPEQRRGTPRAVVSARWSSAISALVYLPCGKGAASLAVGTRVVPACLTPSELSQAPVDTWRPDATGAIVPCWARAVKHKRPHCRPVGQRDCVIRQDGFQGCATHGAILQGVFADVCYINTSAMYGGEVTRISAADRGIVPPRAGNQPSFAKRETSPREVALTATANGYEK